jgi:hypothetical protein
MSASFLSFSAISADFFPISVSRAAIFAAFSAISAETSDFWGSGLRFKIFY